MAAAKNSPLSIAELEQQITKLNIALDKARAQELAAAEKAVGAAQKAWTSAKKKVAASSAKGTKTPTAKIRVSEAKQALLAQTKILSAAQAVLNDLNSAKKSAREVAKTLAAQLKGKGKTKKIKVAEPTIKNKPAAAAITPNAVKPATSKKTLATKVSAKKTVKKIARTTPEQKPVSVETVSEIIADTPMVLASITPVSAAPVGETINTTIETPIVAVAATETITADETVATLTINSTLPFDDDTGALY